MVAAGYYAFPDDEMRGTGKSPCAVAGKNLMMCQLNKIIKESVSEFRFLIAFLLAGFVTRVLIMWTTRRQNYASLCGCTRELNVQIASFLPTTEDRHFVQAARRRLSRWTLLAYELAVLKARDQMDSEETKEHLLKEGLLSDNGEWELLVPGDRHTTVYYWIQSHFVQLSNAGYIPQEYVLGLSQSVARARAQANDLMSALDRDLPFPYVHLCFVLVVLNVFLFSTFKGILWSTWFVQHGDAIWQQPVLWVDVATTFAWNLSYTSMYQLCYVLYHPFQAGSELSVAHTTISKGIRRLAEELARHERLPVVIESTEHPSNIVIMTSNNPRRRRKPKSKKSRRTSELTDDTAFMTLSDDEEARILQNTV